MPAADVLRIADYDRRSRNPDAVSPRDPADADVIVLPVVRVERGADETKREPDMRDVYTRGL